MPSINHLVEEGLKHCAGTEPCPSYGWVTQMQGHRVLWLPEERLLPKGGCICDRPGGEEVLVWGCDSCNRAESGRVLIKQHQHGYVFGVQWPCSGWVQRVHVSH